MTCISYVLLVLLYVL